MTMTLARAVAPSPHRHGGDVLECEVRIRDTGTGEYVTHLEPAHVLVEMACSQGHSRRVYMCQRCLVLDSEYGTWCSACDYQHVVDVVGIWRSTP